MLTRWLRLFTERRIFMPVGPDDLVLDVGCGDKPHWRADVLVDKYLGEQYSAQRNRGGAVEPILPLFETGLERLPFADHSFDFVYCSHVLEHVEDPRGCFEEMVRVAKRGYIEVPFVGLQKIYDQETHLWYCDDQNGGLTFTAKQEMDFDHDIIRFLRRGALRYYAFAMNFCPEATMIRLTWDSASPPPVTVRGTPNLELVDALPRDQASVLGTPRVWSVLRSLLRLRYRRRLRRAPVMYNDIMRPELRLDEDRPLTAQVWQVDFGSTTPASAGS